jgi:hypothetical protein
MEPTKSPSPEALSWLKANPDQAEAFDYKFGPGAAMRAGAGEAKGADTSSGPPATRPSETSITSQPGPRVDPNAPGTAEAPAEPEAPSLGVLETGADVVTGLAKGIEGFANQAVEGATTVLNVPAELENAVTGFINDNMGTDIEPTPMVEAPKLDLGPEPVGVAGNMVAGVSQFLVGLALTRKVTGARGFKGEMANAAITDFTFMDPATDNLSAFMNDNDWAIPVITDALETDPEAPGWANRTRNTVEGLMLGGVTETFLKGIKGLALLKKGKETGNPELASEGSDLLNEAADAGDQAAIDGADAAAAGNGPGVPQTNLDAPKGDDIAIASEAASQVVGKGSAAPAGPIVPPKSAWTTMLEGATDPADAFNMIPPDGAFNFGKMDGPLSGQALIKAASDTLDQEGVLKAFNAADPETQAKTLAKASKEMGSLLGIRNMKARLERLADNSNEMASTLVAGKMFLQSSGREITSLAETVWQKMEAGLPDGAMEQKLLDLMDQHFTVQTHLKAVQTNAARTTSAGRIRTADQVTADQIERLQTLGGRPGMRKIANALRKAKGPQAQAKLIRDVQTPGFMDVINEYWINSILSGYTTHAVNIVSNLANTALLPMERTAGGLMTGSGKQAKQGAYEMLAMRGTIFDSVRLGFQSYKREGSVLDVTAKFEGSASRPKAISAETFGLDPAGAGGATVDAVGKAVRLPGRFLLGADEVFKQINFRSSLKAQLTVNAANMSQAELTGLGFANRGEWVAAKFEGAFSNATNASIEWDEMVKKGTVVDDPDSKEAFLEATIGAFRSNGKEANEALRKARASTFTTPLTDNPYESSFRGFSAGYQKWVNNYPVLRQITPFIQTPVNILDVAMNRTPAFNLLRGSYRRRLQSADPAVRAEAAGEMASGVAITSALSFLVMEGRLTGGGPTDPGMRDTWRQDSGWQPYSMNIGSVEEPNWVEYRRLDPHGFLFGIVADLGEMQKSQDNDPGMEAANIWAMVASAVSSNLTSKTWVQGIADTIEVMESKDRPYIAQAYMENKVASFTPYSAFFRQSGQAFDDVLRDTRTLADKLKMNTPGFSSDIPARHSWLTGESVDTPEHMLGFMKSKDKKGSPVAEELRRLQYGFTGPDRRMGDVKLSTEQFQKWNKLMGTVKLGGKTVEEAAAKLMQSEFYDMERERIPDGITQPTESHRVRKLATIFAAYKKASKARLLFEDPELNKAYREFKLFTDKAQAGAPVGDREDLKLNFNPGLFDSLGLN